MKISVIIPVYNGEKYLEDTLQSVLNQTYKNYEIIVVDDGSTDSTHQIMEKYKGQIHQVINRQNMGIAGTINNGISKMTGDWVKRLSADDLIKPNYMQTMVDEINRLKHRGIDVENKIFYTSFDLIDSDGNFIETTVEPNLNKWTQDDRNALLVSRYYGNASTALFHKNVIARVGLFNPELKYGEDYDYWLRACLLHDIHLYLIQDSLTQYRIHELQTTKTKNISIIMQTKELRAKILDRLPADKKEFYEQRAKELDKKPLSVAIRRAVRDSMVRTLPKNLSAKIINSYLKRKKT